MSNFLFSSVGDNTDFDTLWIDENMEYDIYVIYYGNDEEIYNKYKSKVKFIEKRKGSKFQNFTYFYDTYTDIIDKYDRFFILDDDIIFNVRDINSMFKISRHFRLDICGPSFLPESKLSHLVTKHKPNTILTYTNFVEVNVPLFSRPALDNLMKFMDYSLIGWGIDFLYIWSHGMKKSRSYAIVHFVKCINPKDNSKKNKQRELSLLKNCNSRASIWNTYSKKIGCPSSFKIKEYGSIIPKVQDKN